MAASIQLRGRCRCGEVLSFTLTPAGYKRVCPRCRSVVRLNPKQRESKRRRRPAPAPAGNGAVHCSCGQEILLPPGKASPLVVCPACRQAVPLQPRGQKRPTHPAARKTVELSPGELEELAQELSTAVPSGAAAERPTSRSGWEQGLRVCRDCGELLGMGASVCRHCGTANG